MIRSKGIADLLSWGAKLSRRTAVKDRFGLGIFVRSILGNRAPPPPFLQPIVQAVESLCLKNQRPPPMLRILNVLFDPAFLLPRGRIPYGQAII